MGAGGFEDEAELITKAEKGIRAGTTGLGKRNIRARAKEEDHAE